MDVTCPHCSQVVAVDGAPQSQVECPACHLPFTLPRAEPPEGFWGAFWDRYQWFPEVSAMPIFDVMAGLIFLGLVWSAAWSVDLMNGEEAERFAGMIGLAITGQGLLLVGIYAAVRDLRR